MSGTIRRLGPVTALLYGVDQWLSSRGNGMRLFSYCLVAQPIPREAGNAGDITVREVTQDDPILARFPLEENVLRHRFGQDAICLAAWRGDTLVGCFWLTDGDYLEDEVRCRFIPLPKDRAVWDFDVYLLPEYRLSRGFLQLWQAVFAYLRARGKQWTFSRISAFNARSLASHRAIGAEVVGRIFFIKGRRRQVMVATKRPFVHFSQGESDLPTLEVAPPKRGGTGIPA